MRSKAIFFSHLRLILFALGALHIVQSFQPRCLISKRRYDCPLSVPEYHCDRDLMRLALSLSQLPSTSGEVSIGDHPWYSHPKIGRDRSHVRTRYNSFSDILNRYQEEQQAEGHHNDEGGNDEDGTINVIENSKFLLISPNGMWHRKSCSSSSIASPLYLTASQMDQVVEGFNSITVVSKTIDQNDSISDVEDEPLVAWVGKYEEEDYWVVYLNDDASGTKVSKSQLESILLAAHPFGSEEKELVIDCKALREFGDSLQASHDAGILATANGLVEFHKSHGYCSYCGGRTKSTKAGASRTCTNEGCRKSVYPRIDSAAIMLVTSPCENYALLGRKRSWPMGRYSTLAGFCEVGETLEECCQRETFEESGVVIEPKSIRFAASQPWPFPRSLMVGFRAKAMASSAGATLPEIVVDTNEMEDIRWFAKDFVKESLKLNGSTALTFQPDEDESKFHVPGKASLARFLIKEWVDE